jgi:tetratricopeptide (TPR) repeat protein
MNRFRKLIREIHRRSLWQVLAVYLAGSWVALQVAGLVTQTAGLPEWVPSFAFVILIIGFPIVMATALVQEGTPQSAPERPPPAGEELRESTKGTAVASPGTGPAAESALASPDPPPRAAATDPPVGASAPGLPSLLSWRRVGLGGMAALALLVLAVGASLMASRPGGLASPGSLVAQGIFEVGEQILVADFRTSTPDPVLGALVSEALRVDLSSSGSLTLVTPAAIRETLVRMQEDPAMGLPSGLAREVAARLGVKAVLEGEVGMAGSGYILVATLRTPETGEPLASFRQTAAGDDDLLDALDTLSRSIREKAGESLRAIDAGPRLATVTTHSLEALRYYTMAQERSLYRDAEGALDLLHDAVALDPEFAMAWRRIAAQLGNLGSDNPARVAAATRAYELGHRLSEIERHQTAAFFHTSVTGDEVRAIRAYEAILDRSPDDLTALLNTGLLYGRHGRHEEALALVDRALARYGRLPLPLTSRAINLVALNRFEEADETLREFETAFSGQASGISARGHYLVVKRDSEEAVRHGFNMAEDPSLTPFFRTIGRAFATAGLAAQGRWDEADRLLGQERALILQAGRAFDYLEFSWAHGEFAYLLFEDGDASRSILRQVLASGALDSGLSAHPLGGGTLPYREFAVLAARVGMAVEARDLLRRWEEEGSEWSAEPITRTRLAVEALLLPDPSEGAALLRRYRAESNCPRCFQWELAERLRQAGQVDEAIDAYLELYRAHQDTRRAGVQLTVMDERLGDLHAARGDREEAARRFRAFAEAWSQADAALRGRAERALERALALEAHAG